MEIDEFVYVYRIDSKGFLQGKKKVVSQLDDLGKHSNASEKKISSLNATITDGGKTGVKAFSDLSNSALKFFGVSLTIGGVTALFSGMTRSMTQLGNASAYLDIPVKRLDGLERAASAAGVSAGELVNTLKTMRESQSWLRQGYSSVNQFTQAMARLQSVTGVDLTGAKTVDDLFSNIRQALRSVENKDLRLLLANELGISSGLQRAINDSSFDKNADYFTKTSAANEQQLKQAQSMAVQVEILNQSYSNMGKRLYENVAVPLAEKILPVLNEFVDYLTDHEKDIADFFLNCSDGVKDFSDAVGGAENAIKLLIASYVSLKAKGLLTPAARVAGSAAAGAVGVLGVGATTAIAGLGSLFYSKGTVSQSKENSEIERLSKINQSANTAQYSQEARIPRGIRNNNPGNLEYRGQFNAVGSDGRYAKFATPYEGIKAISTQLMRYHMGKTTGKPLQTVSDIISTWAPANENNAPAYISQVAHALGVNATDRVNLKDNEVMQKMVSAIIAHENGRNPYDKQTISRAIADGQTFNADISQQFASQQNAANVSKSVQNTSTVNHSNSEMHIGTVILNEPVSNVTDLANQLQQQARNSKLTSPYISGVR